MLSSRNEERRKHKGYGILERENITEVGQIQLDKPIALSNDSIQSPSPPFVNELPHPAKEKYVIEGGNVRGSAKKKRDGKDEQR